MASFLTKSDGYTKTKLVSRTDPVVVLQRLSFGRDNTSE